jgi:hypothetical protein
MTLKVITLPSFVTYDMIYLTAIGLPLSGSSTVHIYTQTIHKTTQAIHRTTQFNIRNYSPIDMVSPSQNTESSATVL